MHNGVQMMKIIDLTSHCQNIDQNYFLYICFKYDYYMSAKINLDRPALGVRPGRRSGGIYPHGYPQAALDLLRIRHPAPGKPGARF